MALSNSKQWQKGCMCKYVHIYVCICVLPPWSPLTSPVLEQAFISLPSQQVSSSSTALSSQAKPSQPIITDSTWEEYQQAQTHCEIQQQHWAVFQCTAPFHNFKTPGACRCKREEHAAVSCLFGISDDQVKTLRTQNFVINWEYFCPVEPQTVYLIPLPCTWLCSDTDTWLSGKAVSPPCCL